MKMEPTTKKVVDINDADPKKGVKVAKEMLEKEGLPLTDENIFIAASCKEKGILYLTGKAQVNGIYKVDREEEAAKKKGEYTVTTKNSAMVNGNEYPLNVAFGIDENAIETTKDTAGSAPVASDASAAASHEAVSVYAPMPGLILRLDVKEGQQVKKNQVLLIMEAMKMENEIYAPCDGVVTKIAVSQGQQMQSDDELLVIS